MSTLLRGLDGTDAAHLDEPVKRPAKRSDGTYAGVGRNSGIGGINIMSIEWKRRFKLFVQRFWQPTSACMTCMPGSWGNIMSLAHWTIAFHTGLLTGLLAVLLTFTPVAKLYGNRYGNAVIVGLLTAVGDAYAHASHYRIPYVEHIVTGVVSGLLTLAASYLFEDRARRLRVAWTKVFG
ncbi:hypothetical protein B0G73_101459 [Paraburkholderia sp. BL25I1N1]|nr:hypothetical protein B0G73_101459 [Paraburkholderia sp. BL25I1N1]